MYDRKKKIQKALAEGKPIPTELRDDAQKLKNSLDADDDETAKLKNHIDDEYAKAGIIDPKICVTTSRSPSSRLKAFAKEIRLIFPNSQRINRGNTQVGELVEVCRNNDFTDIVVVQEHRGEPDGLIVGSFAIWPNMLFFTSKHRYEARY